MGKKELKKLVDEFIDNDWGEKARWAEYFGIDREGYLKKLLKKKVKKARCYLIRIEDMGLKSVKHPLNKALCELGAAKNCLAGFAMKKYKIKYQDLILNKPKTAFVCIGKVLYQQGIIK